MLQQYAAELNNLYRLVKKFCRSYDIIFSLFFSKTDWWIPFKVILHKFAMKNLSLVFSVLYLALNNLTFLGMQRNILLSLQPGRLRWLRNWLLLLKINVKNKLKKFTLIWSNKSEFAKAWKEGSSTELGKQFSGVIALKFSYLPEKTK